MAVCCVLLLLRCAFSGYLQMDAKQTSLSHFALGGKLAAHGFYNLAGQRQPQPGTVNSRLSNRRAAIERLKDMLDLVFAYADALVFHGENNLLRLPFFFDGFGGNP